MITNKKSNLEIMYYAGSVDSIIKTIYIDFFLNYQMIVEEKLKKEYFNKKVKFK